MKILKPIDPDEIFLDSSNLPSFNTQQFEGRLERPIAKYTFYLIGGGFLLISLIFIGRVGELQLIEGQEFAARSGRNTLIKTAIVADRGAVFDRQQVPLIWNDQGRKYYPHPGFGHVLGYVSLPTELELAKRAYGTREYVGRAGTEKLFDSILRGTSGMKIEEIDAKNTIHSAMVFEEPVAGQNLTLAIDANLQQTFYQFLASVAKERGFTAGGGVLLDLRSGELIALANYPEYDPQVLAAGDDKAAINAFLNDRAHPFLNRVFDGVYAPGSIIKPFIAIGALNEGVITANETIVSTGALRVENPFFPDQPSIFRDWKAHGAVDMKQALAFSSNVYFYTVGGGDGERSGLGISKIDYYSQLFGLGRGVNVDGQETAAGNVPTPDWKAKVSPGEPWRLGDTYHTAIGQYGFQVTPLQMARAVGAIAIPGRLVYPTLVKSPATTSLVETIPPLKSGVYDTVREGMLLATRLGTAKGLDVPYVVVAAKTGTAELGETKTDVNSWVIGFFPYDHPRYSFAVVMERGARSNLVGAPYVMRQLLDWMSVNTPEYFTD